jgi:hypothetical protein
MKNGYDSRIQSNPVPSMSTFPKNPRPHSPGVILAHAHAIIGKVAEISTTPERTVIPCGYLVTRSLSGQVLLGEKINEPNPPEKLEGWNINALEKTRRLSLNPEHVSAYETRDYANKRYGGGIRAHEYLLGFSGMPEQADEALCVGIALCMGWLSLDQAATIFRISDNKLGRKVVDWLVTQGSF